MLGLLLLVTGFKAELPEPFAIVPAPKYYVPSSSEGVEPSSLRSIGLPAEATDLVLPYNLEHLQRQQGGVRILVSINDLDLPGDEGYRLQIMTETVIIVGESRAGVFYGLQTLSQLVEDATEAGIAIPGMMIQDWPDIAYRAVHFDTKHHLDTIDTYYDAIDRLANLKVNAIVWEFEDKLRYRRQPKVGADHAISIEQMQALTRYARKRFIEISPLVQGLGHASFILKHEEYKHLRDDPNSDWAFCPINEGTYEVLFDLYRDAIEATPGSKYLHIGGDEVHVGASDLAKASGLDPLGLHLHWLNRVNDFLKSEGRTAIMWDDMPLKHGGVYQSTYDASFDQARARALWSANRETLDQVVKGFPSDAVYMRWNYSQPGLPGNNLALDWYAESGLKAMAATAAQTRWTIFPRNNGNVGPIREFCRMTAQRGLDGILCTAWDDDSPHMAFYWRGWTVFADFSWSPEGRDEEGALDAFYQRAYGLAAGPEARDAYKQLEQCMNLWDTMLTSAGSRNVCQPATLTGVYDLPLELGDEEWLAANQSWFEKAITLSDVGQLARWDINHVAHLSTRNAYDLRLASALTNLILWSGFVSFNLQQYNAQESATARATLVKQLNSLDTRWNDFLEVYGEKRILNNPPGYILDQNHHAHQANSSNGPEWMIAVELKFRDKVLEWLKDK